LSAKNIKSAKSAFIGGILALCLLAIDFFLLRDPNSGEFRWTVLPYLSVTLAGAAGGILYFLLNRINFKNIQAAILANFFSVLLYIFLVLIGYAIGTNEMF